MLLVNIREGGKVINQCQVDRTQLENWFGAGLDRCTVIHADGKRESMREWLKHDGFIAESDEIIMDALARRMDEIGASLVYEGAH